MEKPNNQLIGLHPKIKTGSVLFFDMDETLIDTNFANFLSYQKAIQIVTKTNHDITYNPDQRFNRTFIIESIPNLSENQFERIIQIKEKVYKDFLPETKLNLNVSGILLKYSRTNQTILVTNCRKDRALLTLKHHGLSEIFTNIFYRQFGENEIRINKYQIAISILGISPLSVVVFENEQAEIADAIGAGIPESNIVNICNLIFANYE